MSEMDNVFKILNSGGSWVDMHNALLKLSHEDPQKLVDYVLEINGDPFYRRDSQ